MTRVTARARATPARPADQADQDQAAEHPQTLSARPRGSVVAPRNAGALGPLDVPWPNGYRDEGRLSVAYVRRCCSGNRLSRASQNGSRWRESRIVLLRWDGPRAGSDARTRYATVPGRGWIMPAPHRSRPSHAGWLLVCVLDFEGVAEAFERVAMRKPDGAVLVCEEIGVFDRLVSRDVFDPSDRQ